MYSASQAEKILLDTGDYEATITNVDIRSFTSGTQYLNIAFYIENFGNFVYDKIFREKEKPTEFNNRRVGQLLGAVKYKADVNSDFELTQILKNRKLIIHVSKEFDNYLGEEINKVKYYKSSDKQTETTADANKPAINIVDDSDLPF